jgi:hypothetical protein
MLALLPDAGRQPIGDGKVTPGKIAAGKLLFRKNYSGQ